MLENYLSEDLVQPRDQFSHLLDYETSYYSYGCSNFNTQDLGWDSQDFGTSGTNKLIKTTYQCTFFSTIM